MTPEELEKRIARLLAIAEGKGASVTWNDRIRDPDNTEQIRQLDVTIRRGASLTVVECRLHSRPQDVQWIEELAGRRMSLRSDMIIGISSSGFTRGAWMKAEALGVFIYDLTRLNPDEIEAWGARANVRLEYVHFKRASLFLVPTTLLSLPRLNLRTLMLTANGEAWPVEDVFRMASSKLADGMPEGGVTIFFNTRNLFIGSFPVSEIALHTDWRWVKREVSLPVMTALRNRNRDLRQSRVLVEGNDYSQTEIVHGKNGTSIIIDVSLAPSEPRSILRRAIGDLGRIRSVSSVGIIGMDHQTLSPFHFDISICRKNSRLYRSLSRGTDAATEI